MHQPLDGEEVWGIACPRGRIQQVSGQLGELGVEGHMPEGTGKGEGVQGRKEQAEKSAVQRYLQGGGRGEEGGGVQGRKGQAGKSAVQQYLQLMPPQHDTGHARMKKR